VPVAVSEISCVRLRSKSGGIGLAAQSVGAWLFNFFTPYLYNTDQANWGGKIGFFFGGLSVIGYCLTWLELPETKGRTFAELDALFEMGVSARKFKKTVTPGSEDAWAGEGKGIAEKF
jgi:MFS transporter, SP family, general alpha glucoside:H+ symporter